MHNIPFLPGGIDNLSRDSRSISRDLSVLRHARLTDYRATNYQCRQV